MAAATEASVFTQPEVIGDESAVLVDAVHEAYQRLTPLLTDSSRLLHGWSDDQAAQGIRRIRDAVDRAESAARGEACAPR